MLYNFMIFYYTKELNLHFENYKLPTLYKFNYNEKNGILKIDTINKTKIDKEF